MDAETYLEIPSIKENNNFLHGKYMKEFNMSSRDILNEFVKVKIWVADYIRTEKMRILDISGRSLFSPLLVFQGKFKTYSMFYPGDDYAKINDRALKYLNLGLDIRYVLNYGNEYDLILDWNGKINFGKKFNFSMFSILIEMLKNTKEWVVFQSRDNLKLKNTNFNFHDFFHSTNCDAHKKQLPLWANHPDGYTFAVRKTNEVGNCNSILPNK